MSSAKLKFNCTHGERVFGHPHRSFSTLEQANLPGFPHQRVSLSFFRIPSLRAGFLRRVWKRKRGKARASTRFHERSPRNTTVVRDNDNQRVKWGLISFRCGRVERDANESGGCYGGAWRGRKEENACIHLPRNTQACTQHRRILCRTPVDEKGKREGGWMESEKRGKDGWTRLNGDTQERPEHARATCNWVQSSWFSCELFSKIS